MEATKELLNQIDEQLEKINNYMSTADYIDPDIELYLQETLSDLTIRKNNITRSNRQCITSEPSLNLKKARSSKVREVDHLRSTKILPKGLVRHKRSDSVTTTRDSPKRIFSKKPLTPKKGNHSAHRYSKSSHSFVTKTFKEFSPSGEIGRVRVFEGHMFETITKTRNPFKIVCKNNIPRSKVREFKKTQAKLIGNQRFIDYFPQKSTRFLHKSHINNII